MRVRDIMTTRVITLTKGQSLPLADALMKLARVRHIPVIDDDRRLVGLVTHRDLLKAQVSALSPMSDEERSSFQLSVPVFKIMQSNVWTVAPTAKIAPAARMLRDHHFGCLPVVDEGRLVGIVTEADFLRLVADPDAEGEPVAPPTVAEVMTLIPETIDVTATVGDARAKMAAAAIRHLPVMSAGELMGIVSDRDLAIAEGIVGGAEAARNIALGLVGTLTPFTVDRDARLDEVLLDMTDARVGSALVMQKGRLVGILTTTDACRVLASRLRNDYPLP